jgi:hypothetical protein
VARAVVSKRVWDASDREVPATSAAPATPTADFSTLRLSIEASIMFAHRIDEEEKCSNYLRCNGPFFPFLRAHTISARFIRHGECMLASRRSGAMRSSSPQVREVTHRGWSTNAARRNRRLRTSQSHQR